ncbi:hypothetical protein [Neisseria meningitidis]|nr:hypothetical protein [Neisseria meningitidis]
MLIVIPAQAGIQTFKSRPSPINSCGIEIRDSHFRGNDGGGFLVFPKMHIIQNPVIPTKQKIKNSNLKSRPSLPCGNPTYLVSVLFLVSGDF